MAATGTKRIEYLAGVVDGEGCLLWDGGTRLVVNNTFPPMLEELQEAFGGTISQMGSKKEAHHRTCFQWRLSGENARAAIRQLIPYLVEKKPQAQLLLLIWELRKVPGSANYLNQELKRLKRIDYGTDCAD